MRAPSSRELLFSAKAFAASMLALWVAYRMALPRPFWAMMAAYIVANPLAGPVRSKALYRLGGSIVGCMAVMLLVPALANAPELLTLAIALWVGSCLCVSLLDRTPRSYVFMLAGYTGALIGLPSVADPTAVYDTGLARVSEIGLGIVCATLVHGLVFPQGIGPVLLARLDNARRDATRWVGEVLAGRHDLRSERDRRQMAAALTDLRLLATHLPFDTSHLRWRAATLQRLHDRMGELLPLLYAVEDRLLALQQHHGSMPPEWLALLQRIDAYAQAEDPGPDDAGKADALRADVAALAPALHAGSDWRDLLLLNLGSRLTMLVDRLQDARRLRQSLQRDVNGHGAADTRPEVDHHADRDGHPKGALDAFRPPRRTVLHRDPGLALLSGAAVAIGIVLSSWFWIATGWPYGATMPIMVAVFGSFFASMDDPVPAIRGFLRYTLLSVPLAAFYLLVVLPATDDFALLVAMLAPVFLTLGVYVARPATMLAALATIFNVAPALGLQDTNSADFLSFINGTLAQVAGVATAALVTGLLRSISGQRNARRILRANWLDIARVGLAAAPASRSGPATASAATAHLPALMLDRAGLLLPRLAATGPSEDAPALDALHDLRVGMNLGELHRLAPALASHTIDVQGLIAEVAQHYRRRAAGEAAPPPNTLWRDIDRALAATLAASFQTSDGRRQIQAPAACALVALRRDLFPLAPAYLAPLPPAAVDATALTGPLLARSV